MRRNHLYFAQDWGGIIYILPRTEEESFIFCPELRRNHLYFARTEEESFIFCPGMRRNHLYFAQDWGGIIYILPRTDECSFIFCWGLRRNHLYFTQDWGGIIYILPRTEEESFIFCPGLRRSWTSAGGAQADLPPPPAPSAGRDRCVLICGSRRKNKVSKYRYLYGSSGFGLNESGSG
jgi:hypothetical protein